MIRPRLKHLLLGAAVAAVVALWTPRAEAHWGYWRWGGYGAYWTTGYWGCCDGLYLGVRPGPVRRVVFGPYRWYGGWGSCYTPCCSVCACDPCCCWDTCCVSTTTFTTPAAPAAPAAQPQPTEAPKREPTPTPPGPPKPAPAPPPGLPGPAPEPSPSPSPAPQSFFEPTRSDSGLLTIYVPYEAKVFVNGLETKSVGSRRQYVSYGLAPGLQYKYEVRAEIVRDGKIVEEVQTIYLTAGAREGLAFGFNPKPAEGLAAAP